MLHFVTRLLISASVSLWVLTPASALPRMQDPLPQAAQSSAVVNVHGKRRGFYRHHHRHHYNGYHGHRHHRQGYRYYHGYWFPPAAFAFGVIIGRSGHHGGYRIRPGYMNPEHVRWCDHRYRSYRAYDNTFQPYHGLRKRCRSPFY